MQIRTIAVRMTGYLVRVTALTVVLATGVAQAGDPSGIWRDAPPGMTLWEAATGRETGASPGVLLGRVRQLYGIRRALCHGMR